MLPMGRKRKVDNGLEPRLYWHHGAYRYVHPAPPGGKPRWENLGADKEAANKVARGYNNPNDRTGTVVYWLDQFILDCRARVKAGTLAKRTLEDYEGDVGTEEEPGPLRTYFTPEGTDPWLTPQEVTPDLIQDYLDAGLKAKRSTRANRERATLSSCFGWLLRKNHCPGLMVNPCLRGSGVQRNPEKPRERYVWDDEYRDVWEVATRSERLMMELAFRTLQRPESDLILWDTGVISTRPDGTRALSFVQNKTGQRMLIAFSPELDELIPRPAGNVRQLREPIVKKLDGGFYTYDGLSSMLRRSIEVANERRKARKQDPMPPFGFRDCAAKGATDMWRAGVPLETIQALKGHMNKSTTERYVKARWREAVQPNTLKVG